MGEYINMANYGLNELILVAYWSKGISHRSATSLSPSKAIPSVFRVCLTGVPSDDNFSKCLLLNQHVQDIGQEF